MMSTSLEVEAGAAPARAVFAPLPRQHRELDVTGSPATAAPTGAAGYAAGWAQGTAAAAAAERAALARRDAAAEADRAAFAAAADRALAALDAAADQMRRHAVPAVDAVADQLVGAAAELAEVLLGHELSEAEGRGRRALARALAAAPAHEDVVVALNPDDLALLGAHAPGGQAHGRDVRLTADPALAPGDALARFAGGQVDARVSTGLVRMRSTLRAGERA
jgi:flagellar assembly protein FliH